MNFPLLRPGEKTWTASWDKKAFREAQVVHAHVLCFAWMRLLTGDRSGVGWFIMQNVVIIKSDAIIAVVEMGSAKTPIADRQPQCRVLFLDCRSRVRLKVNFEKEKKK